MFYCFLTFYESINFDMKPILNVQDIAINGANPAFEQPLHVDLPNIGSRRAFMHHVGEIFDHRWLSNNGPMVQKLEQRFAELHYVKHCVAMRNDTFALEIAIRARKYFWPGAATICNLIANYIGMRA
jgi:hypothetical protein